MALVRSLHRWMEYLSEPPTDPIPWTILGIRTNAAARAEFDMVAVFMQRALEWTHTINWRVAGNAVQQSDATYSYNYNHWIWAGGDSAFKAVTTMGYTSASGIPPISLVSTEADLIENNSDPSDYLSRRHLTLLETNYANLYTGTETAGGLWKDQDGLNPTTYSWGGFGHYLAEVIFTTPFRVRVFRYLNADGLPDADAYIDDLTISADFYGPRNEGLCPFDLTYQDGSYGPGGSYVPIHTSNRCTGATGTGGEQVGTWTIRTANWQQGGITSRVVPLYGSPTTDLSSHLGPGQPDIDGSVTNSMDIVSEVTEYLEYGYDPHDPLARTTMNRAWNSDGSPAREIWPADGGRTPA